ncbi:hemicentin-1-like isoform X2 [Neoarius graeffei]|uniref:hemicentin-1-like isoform X2 n=1 Tax=Neoarius graeffei TaxID=443677 RepID=UPI00298C82F3|nr:hemicentin-1-like isoform X2 [Neoarius graeffei]
MDIFGQNATFGGSSSLSCLKVDATVFYRMWRNITVGAILMFLTVQPSVAPSSQSLCLQELKVTVTDSVISTAKWLSCFTTCTLSNNPTYIWYKNGEPLPQQAQSDQYYYVYKEKAGSYSCAVRGHEDLRSPAVCVSDEKSCWSVTYSTQNICSLIGSSVEIHSYYTYPNNYKVTKVLWFSKEQADGEAVDVREDEEYQGRVQHTQSSQNNWSLRITNLRERDAQTYRFRFYTTGGDYTGQPGVSLSVTDLKVIVSDLYSTNKKLSCSTTCTLSNNPTYIWYKNGQRVTNQDRKELYLYRSRGDAGSYSCAVRGHEDLRSPAVCVFSINGKSCWSVTYSSQTVCALIGSSVDIHSYYTYPNNYKVTKVLWFSKKQADGEAVDVREDEEYQGRVQHTQSSQNNCSLRITNLRERDAQTYRFRFYTDDPTDKYTGTPGVSLFVTDLKVTVSDRSDQNIKLNCITTCTLSHNPTYIWYKNGERVTNQDRKELYLYRSRGDAGSYSCAVRGHEDLRSPAVCVFSISGKSCWSVTYSSQTICALIGSSVDIHSYYTYPNNYKVTKVLWFSKGQADGEAVDVREDEEYQGRVQHTQSSQNNWSLRITNLTERDAQTYRFRFYTHDPTDKYTGTPGVSLFVTDLKVTVSDGSDQDIKLNCLSTCTLSHNPTYIWYKNRRRVSECKSASCSVAAVSGAVSYSCAVEGHDSLLSPPVYSPKNTRAVVLPSGDTVEGDSVTLSCSSDANPPALNYSWFKQNETADTLLTTGQNYSISNISSQDSGLYYCTAHNQLGHGNSTPTHLDVLPNSTSLKFIMVGLAVFLAVTLLSAALWMWKRKSRSADGHSSTASLCLRSQWKSHLRSG